MNKNNDIFFDQVTFKNGLMYVNGTPLKTVNGLHIDRMDGHAKIHVDFLAEIEDITTTEKNPFKGPKIS